MLAIEKPSFKSNCIFGWLNVNLGLTLTGYDFIAYKTDPFDHIIWAAAITQGLHEVFIDHAARNYATTWAGRELLNRVFAFCFSLAPRITCHVSAENFKSINFMNRVGFVKEGQLRRAFDRNTDTIVFGMLEEDWYKSPFFKKEFFIN